MKVLDAMRRFAVILVFAVGFCAAARAGVEFFPSECDFGELGPLESADRIVTVRNTGTSPVHILRVRACCGAEASVSADTLGPSETADIRISIAPGTRGGRFRKTVTVVSDDPGRPIATIAVVGSVRNSVPSLRGDEVVFGEPGERPESPQASDAGADGATLPLSVSAVVAAGVVDGFNPCSFAIMISLAGILAIGGRRRRARILGGLSFCFGSFVTYMLMGFGLLQALRALEGLRLVHAVLLTAMSVGLFVLSFLSFRDAFRFHRIPVFTVVTLKLPEGVKNLIRRVAMSSWSGPTVVLAGFGCAVVVTLLDALCTGQVYIPVLTYIAMETGSARAFSLLVLYNLAFIAPLVAVFVLASKTTDAFQMAKWSSRNVIPAKIALGVLFAFLGWQLWPKGGQAADPVAESSVKAASGELPSRMPAVSAGGRAATERRDVERMTDAELASGNERLDAFLRAPALDPEFPKLLVSTITDAKRDPQWRNHCLQFVPECMLRIDGEAPERKQLEAVLARSLADRPSVLAGTALLGYLRLSEQTGDPTAEEVVAMAVSLASDASSAPENIVTALRVGTELSSSDILAPARYWATRGEGAFVRMVAISAVRDLGGAAEIPFLSSLLPARTKAEETAVRDAIRKLEEGK